MNCIQIMVEEHENIKRMLKVTTKYCMDILEHKKVEYEDFFKIIDFIRNYADKHHHGKEEIMLFNRMVDEIGGAAEKLVKFGMLVEHDMGRFYIQELEFAVREVLNGNQEARLKIITYAMSYVYLLQRHIEKENEVAYIFAEENLKQETLDRINEECAKFEKEAKENQMQQRYLNLLYELEKKI